MFSPLEGTGQIGHPRATDQTSVQARYGGIALGGGVLTPWLPMRDMAFSVKA